MTKPKTKRRRRTASYRVFVSHATVDTWVAKQIAKEIEALGASTFIDAVDIDHGEEFRKRIIDELERCDELLALLTPEALKRTWIQHEIGAAFGQRKTVVAVLYKVTDKHFKPFGGSGMLDGVNRVEMAQFDTYFEKLGRRLNKR